MNQDIFKLLETARDMLNDPGAWYDATEGDIVTTLRLAQGKIGVRQGNLIFYAAKAAMEQVVPQCDSIKDRARGLSIVNIRDWFDAALEWSKEQSSRYSQKMVKQYPFNQ